MLLLELQKGNVCGDDLPATAGAHPRLALAADARGAVRDVLGVRHAEIATEGRNARIAQAAALIDGAALAAKPIDVGVAIQKLSHAIAQRQRAVPEEGAQRVEIVRQQRGLVARKGGLELRAHLRDVDFRHQPSSAILRCAIQRRFSTAEKNSSTARLKAAGSSLLMVWPVRGRTRRPARGHVRFSMTL